MQNYSVLLHYFPVFQPQLQSGIGVDRSSGSVTFQDGERWAVAQVKVIGDGFLEAGSTFSLSLVSDPVYLGSEGKKWAASSDEAKSGQPFQCMRCLGSDITNGRIN